LQVHLHDSLWRLIAGFVAGSSAGLAFGVAMGLSRAVEQSFGPIFHALRQVPSVAFIPMLILLLGVEESFKVVIVAKAAFFPVALATMDAVHGIPRAHFEVARAYRLPLPLLLRRVVLPATVPPVVTGLRISLGRSWMVLVAAELLAADSGIGQMMEMGRQMFRLDIVLLGVVITGLIGFAMDRVFRAIEARLAAWQRT
jgi:sulfonate transport system permease protein